MYLQIDTCDAMPVSMASQVSMPVSKTTKLLKFQIANIRAGRFHALRSAERSAEDGLHVTHASHCTGSARKSEVKPAVHVLAAWHDAIDGIIVALTNEPGRANSAAHDVMLEFEYPDHCTYAIHNDAIRPCAMMLCES